MLTDVKYSLRMMRRTPGVTAVAVLSLALGIGANTAIFCLIDTVLLKMLPVQHPEQLYFIENKGARGGGGAPPYPCFETFRDRTRYFSGIAAFEADQMKISVDGQPEQVLGLLASGSYFALLGVRPFIGRVLTAADDSVPGKGGPDGPVAVIGYGYWKRRFGMNPSVLGKPSSMATRRSPSSASRRPNSSACFRATRSMSPRR